MAASVDRAVGTLSGLHTMGCLASCSLATHMSSVRLLSGTALSTLLWRVSRGHTSFCSDRLGSESDATAWRCPVAVE